MILGYEQPVDIPVMSMYDKDMMKLYIGALQKDYERGLEELKQFYKDNSNFFSPSAEDTKNYYNMTIGAALDLMKRMLDQGIDPYRSVQGRAMIQNFINTIPYGDLANIKLSAENLEAFNKNKEAMIKAGTYSDDMQKFFGIDPTNYNTLQSGTWQHTSPYRFETIQQNLLPVIEQLQKAYREDTKKSGNGYTYYNVPRESAEAALNNAYGDLMNKPAMQYHFLKSGMTEDLFKKMLVDQALALTPEKKEADQIWLARFHEAQNNQRHRESIAAQRAARRSGSGSGGGSLSLLDAFPWFTKRTKAGVIDKSRGFGSTGNLTYISEYFRNRALQMEKKYGRYDTKHKDYEGRTVQDLYNYANWWGNISKMSGQELIKKGIINADGTPSELLHRVTRKALGLSEVGYTGAGNASNTILAANSFYDLHAIKLNSPSETNVALKYLSGNNTPQANIPGYGKRLFYEKNLRSGGWSLSANRKRTLAGITKINSIDRGLENYLRSRGVMGYVQGTSNMSVASFPDQRGGRTIEFNGTVKVPSDVIYDYFKYAGITSKTALKAMLQRLGITSETKQHLDKGATPEGKSWLTNGFTTYFDIPITQMVDNDGGFGHTMVDAEEMKEMFGQTYLGNVAMNIAAENYAGR